MASPMRERCPYLRLETGQDWALPGSTSRHRCFVRRQPERIGTGYQQATCLTIGHRQCPRLAGRRSDLGDLVDPAVAPLRAAAAETRQRATGVERMVGGLVAAGLLAFLFVASVVAYRLVVSRGQVPAVPVAEESPVVPTDMVPAATTTPLSPQPTAPVSATDVAAVVSPPAAGPETATATATVAPNVPAPATSPPTRLVISKIGLDIPIKPVGFKTVVSAGKTKTVWADLPNAGAFHETSAYPGQIGNTVINGHRDIKGSVFRHLDRVEVGDEIQLYVGEDVYPYVVSQTLVVPETFASAKQRAQNLQLIGYMPEERLTLITCTPVGLATHRLLVIAKPALPTIPEMPEAGSEPGP